MSGGIIGLDFVPNPQVPNPGEQWKHIKTGTVYEIVCLAQLVSGGPNDGTYNVVYRNTETGVCYVRSMRCGLKPWVTHRKAGPRFERVSQMETQP